MPLDWHARPKDDDDDDDEEEEEEDDRIYFEYEYEDEEDKEVEEEKENTSSPTNKSGDSGRRRVPRTNSKERAQTKTRECLSRFTTTPSTKKNTRG